MVNFFLKAESPKRSPKKESPILENRKPGRPRCELESPKNFSQILIQDKTRPARIAAQTGQQWADQVQLQRFLSYEQCVGVGTCWTYLLIGSSKSLQSGRQLKCSNVVCAIRSDINTRFNGISNFI